jgi:hypothetical protein
MTANTNRWPESQLNKVFDQYGEEQIVDAPKEVYQWLKLQAITDTLTWHVYIGSRNVFVTVPEYIQSEKSVEEETKSAEDIRLIVREELEALLKSMAQTAHGCLLDNDPSSKMGPAFRAIREVCEKESLPLPHDWECDIRKPKHYTCSCKKTD